MDRESGKEGQQLLVTQLPSQKFMKTTAGWTEFNAVFSRQCMGVSVPLRDVLSSTGLPSKWCAVSDYLQP